jgi:hypothetical protein
MMASIPSMAASGSDAGISESTTTANYASRSVEEYGASTHDELALASQAPPGSAVASILSGSCRSRCERLCTPGCGGRSRNRNGRDPAPLRETRLDEEPLRGLAPSARSIAELLSCNDPRPFALFGHGVASSQYMRRRFSKTAFVAPCISLFPPLRSFGAIYSSSSSTMLLSFVQSPAVSAHFRRR